MDNFIGFGFLLLLLFIGLTFGKRNEARHYRRIRRRERESAHIPIIISEWKDSLSPEDRYDLVHGSVVVGSDYFKTFAAGIRQIFGGNVTSFETLLDRGRREAILRMKEQAMSKGADKIINMRLETSSIGSNQQGKGGLPSVEIHAYATSVASVTRA
jgi:uncharacterized protein YbjQ (UPF0145 family)